MKLAILIPSTPDRAELLNRLGMELHRQIEECNAKEDVFVFVNEDNREKTTGFKRNELISEAVMYKSEYIAFHDSDDMPGPTYIKRGLEVVESGMDCGELWGQIYWDGKPGKPFHHSIVHKEWWEDDKFYYRMPNHLNFQKLSLVKDIPFPDQFFGEDGKQSYAMRDSGIFKSQYSIPEVIYHYYCGEPKHAL